MRFSWMRRRYVLVSVGAALILAIAGISVLYIYPRFGGKKDTVSSEHGDDEKISDEIRSKAIEVGATAIETYVKAPGVVDFHPKHALRMHSAFPGVVVKVFKDIGDTVNIGESLAIVESNVGVQLYTVSSPIRGTVLSKTVGAGQSIAPEEEIFSVGDATVLQARFAVAARDVKAISKDQQVTIVAENRAPVRSKISFLSPILDESTRTAAAIVDLTESNFKPGMFVTGAIVVGTVDVKASLPASLCENGLDSTSVSVIVGDEIEQRTIRFGKRDYFTCEVADGLRKGEKILPSPLLAATHDAEEEEGHHHDE